MMQLAQAAEAQGISAMEWVLIIGAIAGALSQIFTLLGWNKAAKVAKKGKDTTALLIQHIDGFKDAHPEIAGKADAMTEAIRKSAADLGLEHGEGGLKEHVLETRRLTNGKKVAGAGAIFLASLLFLSGCSIPSGYVVADRMTYDAIAPEYRAYVKADPLLNEKQKDRRYALLDSEEARISEAEGVDDE